MRHWTSIAWSPIFPRDERNHCRDTIWYSGDRALDFLSYVHSHDRVLLDGATGTELFKRGLTGAGESNLTAPEVVLEVQRAYARCGCDAVVTNTLTMNRINLETHGIAVDVREVNRAGVELARQAAGDDQFVLGNLSSTGQMLEPYGTYEESEFGDTFREQAAIQAEAGVDGFIIESMFDVREALCALRACKEVSSLPAIVSMTFATEEKGGRTFMGNTAEECATRLTDAGADIIGTNCGDLYPAQMATVVSLLRAATSLPILAEPNAGRPRLDGEETVFDMSPEAFAADVDKCVQAGARLVGGCCGTSPEYIRALAGER